MKAEVPKITNELQELNIFDKSHMEKLTVQAYSSNNFEDLRRMRKFIDLHIRSTQNKEADQVIHAHQIFLASVSPFFSEALENLPPGADDPKELAFDIDFDVLDDLIQYYYTGHICIRDKDVELIYFGSKKLSIPDISKVCLKFMMDNIRPCNWQQRRNFAIENEIPELQEKLDLFFKKNYLEIIFTDYFKNMSFEQMKSLVTYPNWQSLFPSEEETQNGVLSWNNLHTITDKKEREERLKLGSILVKLIPRPRPNAIKEESSNL